MLFEICPHVEEKHIFPPNLFLLFTCTDLEQQCSSVYTTLTVLWGKQVTQVFIMKFNSDNNTYVNNFNKKYIYNVIIWFLKIKCQELKHFTLQTQVIIFLI